MAESAALHVPQAEGLDVVHGVMSLELGGVERLVLDMARAVIGRGGTVGIVCVDRRGRLADEAECAGARVHSLDKPPGRSREAVAHAQAVLAQWAPRVVHTHQLGALLYLGRAARRLGLRGVVHTQHTDQVALARGKWDKLRAQVQVLEASRLSRRICCLSAEAADGMATRALMPRTRLRVVPNGIDLARFADRTGREALRAELGFAPGDIVVGTVGRLEEVKRHDLLLEAFAAVAAQDPRLRLLVVGDGSCRTALEAQASREGVADRVRFVGYQATPQHFLAAMDVFAMTSRHEGLPLAILEAWGAGLPVVCSAVGGLPDLLEGGACGLLFPSGDAARLAEHLRRLSREPAERARLADAGLARTRSRYSLDAMLAAYERIYQEALSE